MLCKFFPCDCKKSRQAQVREATLAASAKRKERVDPRSSNVLKEVT